jgi:hypothetical protein
MILVTEHTNNFGCKYVVENSGYLLAVGFVTLGDCSLLNVLASSVPDFFHLCNKVAYFLPHLAGSVHHSLRAPA